MPDENTRVTNVIQGHELDNHFAVDQQGNITLNDLKVNETIAEKIKGAGGGPGKAGFVRVAVDAG